MSYNKNLQVLHLKFILEATLRFTVQQVISKSEGVMRGTEFESLIKVKRRPITLCTDV